MSITVSGRHDSVSEAIKEHAGSKVREIIEGRNKITSAKIILDVEKNRQKVEVLIQGKNLVIEADFESYDMFESIDKAVAKADRQLEKHFDKKQDHHKRPTHTHTHKVDSSDTDDDFDDEME